MDINIRQAVLQNVSGSSEEEITATIEDAISRKEEKMLPGLGVLLEVYWNEAEEQKRNELVQSITQGLS
ncbi:small acid-soluble spore protein SspI [Salsuginibacillus kocurii]|uniref:small acid-soluble spore protein SspI n=1 Tax=Salsuginibacillus kocurii TaxID=427078 RepID=UPI00037B5DC0|nr:small acid-soluble spore protein SspI [Salsuginibacillus kocurii]